MHNMRSDSSLRDTYGVQPARSRAPSRALGAPLDVAKARANGKDKELSPVAMSPVADQAFENERSIGEEEP